MNMLYYLEMLYEGDMVTASHDIGSALQKTVNGLSQISDYYFNIKFPRIENLISY
jgi:hypothetical protein